MTQAARDIMIGITSAVALLGLATLLFLFGELDPIFNPRYAVTVVLNDAGGLRPGSSVELNGVTVGLVDDVNTRLSDDPARLVHVIALVQRDVQVPADVTATVQRSLIGGGATLQFLSPSEAGRAVSALPDDGSAIVLGEYRELVDQVADALDERLQPLAKNLEGFDDLTRTYTTLGENLNDLVRPQTAEEVAAGTAPNLRRTIAKLDQAIDDARTVFNDDLRRTLGLAEDWLGDEQMKSDVRTTVQDARSAVENLNKTLDRYRGLADELASSGQGAVQQLTRAADDLSLTLEEVRRVTKLATEGRGTAGQLLNNPDLYNALNDAATRLDRVLVQLQLLIEKIRAEGLRIGG